MGGSCELYDSGQRGSGDCCSTAAGGTASATGAVGSAPLPDPCGQRCSTSHAVSAEGAQQADMLTLALMTAE